MTRSGTDDGRRGNSTLDAPLSFAALLLLPWYAFVGTALFIEAGRALDRRLLRTDGSARWYRAAFSAAVTLVTSALALGVLNASRGLFPAGLAAPTASWLPFTLAVICVAVALDVALHHLLVSAAVRLAPEVAWHEAGFLQADGFAPSFLLPLLGFPLALLWTLNPWYVLPALAPLGLVLQATTVRDPKKQVTTDARIGLVNLRGFDELFESELHRALRYNRPLALVAFDVDRFKPLNDMCGQVYGDAVLERIGRLTHGLARAYDIVARLGGDEFAVVLPETDARQAQAFAERLRTAIAAEPFAAGQHAQDVHVTISIGIAAFPAHGIDRAGLREAADQALNAAKQCGRDCTVLALPIGSPRNVSNERTA